MRRKDYQILVGIELGRAHGRRELPASPFGREVGSQFRDGHVFRSPLSFRKAEFPGPVGNLGLSMLSLPIRDEAQARWYAYAPNTQRLLTSSCHFLCRLAPALSPSRAPSLQILNLRR